MGESLNLSHVQCSKSKESGCALLTSVFSARVWISQVLLLDYVLCQPRVLGNVTCSQRSVRILDFN